MNISYNPHSKPPLQGVGGCILLFLSVLAMLPNDDLWAQQKRKNEASVYVSGGYSALQYSIEGSNSTALPLGIGGGADYTYYVNNRLGIVTGIDVANFSGNVSIDNVDNGYSSKIITKEGNTEDIIYVGRYDNYNEQQNAVFIHIPVMLQVVLPAFYKRNDVYLAAGAKAGMSMSADYRTSYNRLTTSAYFPYSGQTIANIPQMNLVTRTNTQHKYDIDDRLSLGFNVALTGEAGIRWSMEHGAMLYTGFYAFYGLLNVLKQKDAPLVAATTVSAVEPAVWAYTSILEARNQQQTAWTSPDAVPSVVTTRYSDKINLISAGIKIKLAFNADGRPWMKGRRACGCPDDY